MTRLNLNKTLISILYFFEALIICFQIFQNHSAVSLLHIATIAIVFALWLYNSLRHLEFLDFFLWAIIGVTLIVVLINSAKCGSEFSFFYMKKMFMFFSCLIFFRVAIKIRTDYKTINFIYALNTLLALAFVCAYIFMGDQNYVFKGQMWDYLTFNFSNPNHTAIFLLFIAMTELINAVRVKKYIWKSVHFALFVTLAYFLILTKSRNCILVFVGLVFVYCMFFFLKSYRILSSKFSLAVMIMMPTLFLVIYMLYYDSELVAHLFSAWIDSHKGLSARVEIWKYGLNAVKEYPLLGAYAQITRTGGPYQLHNTHLDIAASYGIIVYLLTIGFLYRLSLNIWSKKVPHRHLCLGWMFLVALSVGNAEASLFSGGLGEYFFAGFFLLLVNSEESMGMRKTTTR